MIDFRALKAAIKSIWANNRDGAVLAFFIALVFVSVLSIR